MAAVHHDNVVVIFEVGMNEGTPFMAMEMLRGETLEAVNTRKDARDYDTVIRYASQIAEGLAAAHEKGIVHRDIKPANIWIEEGSQRVKILDFGLALAQSPLDEFAGVGSVCGTPGYLTPEQARSDPLDDRSDLYSLGAVPVRNVYGPLADSAARDCRTVSRVAVARAQAGSGTEPRNSTTTCRFDSSLAGQGTRRSPTCASALVKELEKVAIQCDAKSETATLTQQVTGKLEGGCEQTRYGGGAG